MLRRCVGSLLLSLILITTAPLEAQNPAFLGMGDSIGEGVQSGDASHKTQPFSYHNLIATRMAVPFALPLIFSTPVGVVGETFLRFRIRPSVEGLNLSVSGADVDSLLNDRADTVTDSETDLVLSPRTGSQMEIAESLRPQLVVCWIGNNDALSAATSFYQLDASQLTPLADFTRDFTAIAARLKAIGDRAVFGTIPDVSRIAFMITRDEVIEQLGSDFGMAPGDLTTFPTLLLIDLGLGSTALLQNPDFILSAAEAATVSQRITDFNAVIKQVAAENGMGVADIHQLFEDIASNPPVFLGIPLSTRYIGGVFSLDAVHPSNIGQAIVANTFINAINTTYGSSIPPHSLAELTTFFANDPFVDKDGDGVVTGRPGAGLLETLSAILGISGDPNDQDPTVSSTAGALRGRINPQVRERFLDEHEKRTGRSLRNASFQARLEEFSRLFGLQRFTRRVR